MLDEVKARGQVSEEDFPKVFGRISLLRQRRHPPDRGDREAAGDGPPLERDRARALRRHRREDAALPLRSAGQLARPHRGAAGEQRPADRPRGARGHPQPRRPRAGDPASGLERGDGPAPALGPAVEPADPAGARQRDRPARVPGRLRGIEGDGRPGRGADRAASAPRWPSSKSRAAPSPRSPT